MPELSRGVVVANTTPIIALSLISELGLLQHLYGEVLTPRGIRLSHSVVAEALKLAGEA